MFAKIDWNNILTETPIVPVLAALTVGLVALIYPQWRKAQQAAAETRLKEKMIDRGYSPDEIARVVNAGVGKARLSDHGDGRESAEPFVR